jgi:hypothetical protein
LFGRGAAGGMLCALQTDPRGDDVLLRADADGEWLVVCNSASDDLLLSRFDGAGLGIGLALAAASRDALSSSKSGLMSSSSKSWTMSSSSSSSSAAAGSSSSGLPANPPSSSNTCKSFFLISLSDLRLSTVHLQATLPV